MELRLMPLALNDGHLTLRTAVVIPEGVKCQRIMASANERGAVGVAAPLHVAERTLEALPPFGGKIATQELSQPSCD